MAAVARAHDVVTAINTQYAAAADPYLELCRQVGVAVDPATCASFSMRMDSRGGKEGASGEKVWIDLASHPLSLLLALVGPGEPALETARCTREASGVRAEFIYRTAAGRDVRACIETANVPDGPLARRFGLDGHLADYEGRNDETGTYAAYLSLGGTEARATDFMRESITRFVQAVRGECAPLADVRAGLRNLEMQVRLLRLARQGAG
jgi:predicted dehydrogenase